MSQSPISMRVASSTGNSTGKPMRLGYHHFAHLRAVAEGLTLIDSARRYLGIEHGHQAKTAHQQTVDTVRAIARRRGEGAWRLIGITIRVTDAGNKPSLEDFIAERGLDGWSESEVGEMYAEAYPSDPKATRRYRLRERQIELIKQLEGVAAERPVATDMVNGWFDDVTAAKLTSAGMVTLGGLNAKVSAGGRWYGALPGVGKTKADRIAAHLETLLPRETQIQKSVFALVNHKIANEIKDLQEGQIFEIASEINGLQNSLLAAKTDGEAIQAWIQARAGSAVTSKAYQREATRLVLWLQQEKAGKTFSGMTIEDCRDYMTFLEHIPARWISRTRAAPGQLGWAPFRGPLSHQSRRQAIVIVASMFTWLQSAQYIQANPWVLVNKKTGDDREHQVLDTKAFSEVVMSEIYRFIDEQDPSPSRTRIRFILRFVESVGLRSAELLQARLGDLRLEPEGWVMQVFGKGAKNRVVAIPGQAFNALQDYLDARGLGGIETAPADAPLLASTKDPMAPVGYQALYEHVESWISRAVSASALPANERAKLAGASTHWLRHTFGTRAVSREVPLDVIQAQMGHASIQTTMNIYGRAPIKRRVDELGRAFG